MSRLSAKDGSCCHAGDATLEDGGSTLVLLGDTPLLTATALQGLVQSKAAVNLLSFNAVNPTGYGRVKRGSDGSFKASSRKTSNSG